MYYHVEALRPGSRKKTIINKTEAQVLSEIVIPFVNTKTINAKWGKRARPYQVLELHIYKTNSRWDKKAGKKFETFIGAARNIYPRFEKIAKKSLGETSIRVFIVMPIQGEKFGTQNDQRIYQAFEKRFEFLEKILEKWDCTAIRIDKEHPLDSLVESIKQQIEQSSFIIADLTEERPSCYFEVGYAEALKKPVIYIASKNSIIDPQKATKIHFDIHKGVKYFTNDKEMREKVKEAIEKNKNTLLKKT